MGEHPDVALRPRAQLRVTVAIIDVSGERRPSSTSETMAESKRLQPPSTNRGDRAGTRYRMSRPV